MNQLATKLTRKGFQPRHVAEVGVYHPEASNVYDYVMANVRCTLVEPDPTCARMISTAFAEKATTTLYPVAICDQNGEVELVRRGPSTFLAELPVSPALVNDDYQHDPRDRFRVEAWTFDRIDDGSIELLSIDTEGSEWFVLKNLVSRPAVISVETHGARYTNPYLGEIRQWMRENGYCAWYKSNSDTVFVRRGAISVTLTDRLILGMTDVGLAFRKFRKNVQKSLKRRKPPAKAAA